MKNNTISSSSNINNERKKRCSKCLMPDTCPDIYLDQNGVCNYCNRYKEAELYGEEALLKKLRSSHGEEYDCLLGLSGGKDSSYVAYFAKERLKLRTLAVFYDSPFYCDLARKNIKNVCDTLDLDLIIVKSKNNLEYNILHNHLMSVLPSGKSWGQCKFCHYGIDAILYNVAKERKIPFILSGFTRHEHTVPINRKKVFLSMMKKLQKRDLWRFVYYQTKALFFLINQRRQFRLPFKRITNVYKIPKFPSDLPEKIAFFDYIKWDQKEIEHVLTNNVGWIKPDTLLSWGYDCILEPLLNYSTIKEMGISTTGIYLSNLIRIGQFERDEALFIMEKYENDDFLRNKVEYVLDFLKIPKTIQEKFFETK